MKFAFVFCLMALQGCANVTHSSPKLHDGRWGAYNEGMAEQCAHAAMAQGVKHNLSNKEISTLFNQCVFDQGLTI